MALEATGLLAGSFEPFDANTAINTTINAITKNDNQERKFNAQVIYPIISQGDVIGSVVLISKDDKKKMTDTEEKVAQSAAGFLSGQMEI